MPSSAILAASNNAQAVSEWMPTSEPLVEVDGNGNFRPAGHPFGTADWEKGLNSYGLTDEENVAFWRARARVDGSGASGPQFITIFEANAIRDAGLGPSQVGQADGTTIVKTGATLADKIAFVEKLEATKPLPVTYYTPQPDTNSILAKEAALKPIDAGFVNFTTLPSRPIIMLAPATKPAEQTAETNAASDIAPTADVGRAIAPEPAGIPRALWVVVALVIAFLLFKKH